MLPVWKPTGPLLRWESAGEGEFVEMVDKATRGTEITLHLREGGMNCCQLAPVPRLGLYFDQSPFRRRFEDKGRFTDYHEGHPHFCDHSDRCHALGRICHPGLAIAWAGKPLTARPFLGWRNPRALTSLSPAEQRVAQHVLAQPRSVLNDPIATIARSADVSQPGDPFLPLAGV